MNDRENDHRTPPERVLAGDPYIADDPELAADALRARRLQDACNRTTAERPPGVTIGEENTVVGAGPVVTRELPAGVLAVGDPARVVRSL